MIAWYNPPLSDQQKYPPYQFTDHQSDSGARDGDPRETWSNYCVGLHLQVAFKSISMEISREVIGQVKVVCICRWVVKVWRYEFAGRSYKCRSIEGENVGSFHMQVACKSLEI